MNLNDIITEAKNENIKKCFNRFYYIIREYELAEKVFNAWSYEINPVPDPVCGDEKLRVWTIIQKALREWFLEELMQYELQPNKDEQPYSLEEAAEEIIRGQTVDQDRVVVEVDNG